jgi:hypothetical protein
MDFFLISPSGFLLSFLITGLFFHTVLRDVVTPPDLMSRGCNSKVEDRSVLSRCTMGCHPGPVCPRAGVPGGVLG